MSSTPNTPGDDFAPDVGATPRWVLILFIAAFLLVGYLLYAAYADRQWARKSLADADTKTQGQSLDDGLSRIRHTNCECSKGNSTSLRKNWV